MTMTRIVTAQCASSVHTYYADQDQALVIARARSREGMFFVPVKCSACSGWRLKRVS
jgi:hypothetical protein